MTNTKHRDSSDLLPSARRLPSLLHVPSPTPAVEVVPVEREGEDEGEGAAKYYLDLLAAYPAIDANEYHALRFTPTQWAQRNSPQGRLALQRQRAESAALREAGRGDTAGGGDA